MRLLALPPEREKLTFHVAFRRAREGRSEDGSDVLERVEVMMDPTCLGG